MFNHELFRPAPIMFVLGVVALLIISISEENKNAKEWEACLESFNAYQCSEKISFGSVFKDPVNLAR